MKKLLSLTALTLILAYTSLGQKIEKPKLTSQPPTAAQKELISDGIELHEAKRYDEAIKKYEQVLQENPDCTAAMYELSNTLYSKGDLVRAEAMAVKGTQYRSAELPLFYMAIGNSLDDSGKSAEAIALFKKAAKILKDDKSLNGDLAAVDYNLAITYFRQKMYAEAKATLKEGLTADPGHPSSNYLLSEIYYGTHYKMPALMAVTRFIGIERNGPRAKRAAQIFLDILKPAQKDEKTGNFNILLSLDTPKDEGEFDMYELILGITGVRTDEDKNKSENEMFVDSVSSVFGLVSEDKKLPKTFVGKIYAPYMAAMRDSGQVHTFAYVVLHLGGNADATKWVDANIGKVNSFFSWAKNYKAVDDRR